jgi:hypothetical protein
MKAGRKPARRSGGADTAVATAAPARGRRASETPTRERTRRAVEGAGRPARGRARPQESRGQRQGPYRQGPQRQGPHRQGPQRQGPHRQGPQRQGPHRQGPQTAPAARPAQRPARPKTASQAKARAKARKAKAPKVIRPPLRERLLLRIDRIDLSPRTLLAKIPFVVLVIGALAVGLGMTLWLSTDAAQRSYQLSSARAVNDALSQQKEALERNVLEAQSAPALADAARNLGMIPSRDTAHLVKDPAGNWVVVGQPKPAEGAPPPPLNFKLPDENPVAPAKPAPVAGPAPKPGAEVEVPVLRPVPPNTASVHGSAGASAPGPLPLPGPGLAPVPPPPAPGPVGDTLATPLTPPAVPPVPTVAAVAPVTDGAIGPAAVGAPH